MTTEPYHRSRKWRQARLAGAVVGAVVGAAIMRWRPVRVRVSGESMAPTLRPGDWALAVSSRRIRDGDVVVVEHPERPGVEMVKRVVVAPDGRTLGPDEYWVQGDHTDPDRSTDSRDFGPVPRELIRARVLLVYGPGDRRRVLSRRRRSASW